MVQKKTHKYNMNYNGIRLDSRVGQKKKKRPGGRNQIFPPNKRKCVFVFNTFEFIEMFVVGGANKRQAESGSCNNTIFLDSTLFLSTVKIV